MPQDFADRHVERWRDHWIDIDFDDEVEAATVRLNAIVRHLHVTTENAIVASGLSVPDYDTLHVLMIRDTPGRATPSDLAERLGISPAGMTGRLAGLEKAGYLKRTPNPADRRSVDVEATSAGVQAWRHAMNLRGPSEDELLAALTERERTTLNRLLKKMLLAVGDPG